MAITYMGRKLDDQNQPYSASGIGTAGTVQAGQQPQYNTSVPKYTPSAQVQQAQQAMQQVQSAKPQGYTSKYQPQLDAIMQQIQNPEKFTYSFNNDEMFKYYADLYTQKGKQAAQDTMGQAAALTGGYGNSYAQSVADQTYQQYLLSLYEKGDQLRQEAYQRHQDDRADLYNRYNTMQAADQTDYGRYRDAYSDWENERAYQTDQYYNLYNQDYGAWSDDWNRNMQQNQFDWDQAQYNQKVNQDYALAILANGQMPSDDMLAAAGLSKEDAMLLMAQLGVDAGGSGGGGGGRGSSGKQQDAGTMDADSKLKNPNTQSKDKNGSSSSDKTKTMTSDGQKAQWFGVTGPEGTKLATATDNMIKSLKAGAKK